MSESAPHVGGAAQILVVHGDRAVREALVRALRAAGFAVRGAPTGRDAERVFNELRPTLVILDIVLPDVDGLAIARRLQERLPPTPVLFVSARQDMDEKVTALALGDDYVTTPFGAAEIVARVRAVLRRRGASAPSVLRFRDIELDERTHEVRRSGALAELTPTEFDLLRFFILNPRRVLTKQQILENVWNGSAAPEEGEVETYVSYLRRKLDRLGPPVIRTVRRVGYTLRAPEE